MVAAALWTVEVPTALEPMMLRGPDPEMLPLKVVLAAAVVLDAVVNVEVPLKTKPIPTVSPLELLLVILPVRSIALPLRVNAAAVLLKVIPSKFVLAVKLLVFVVFDPEKIRLSFATGAVPPQFPAAVQLPELTPPVHVSGLA